MGKTNLERQEALRARRAEKGLKRFEVWAHPMDWPFVKRLADKLAKRRERK